MTGAVALVAVLALVIAIMGIGWARTSTVARLSQEVRISADAQPLTCTDPSLVTTRHPFGDREDDPAPGSLHIAFVPADAMDCTLTFSIENDGDSAIDIDAITLGDLAAMTASGAMADRVDAQVGRFGHHVDVEPFARRFTGAAAHLEAGEKNVLQAHLVSSRSYCSDPNGGPVFRPLGATVSSGGVSADIRGDLELQVYGSKGIHADCGD